MIESQASRGRAPDRSEPDYYRALGIKLRVFGPPMTAWMIQLDRRACSGIDRLDRRPREGVARAAGQCEVLFGIVASARNGSDMLDLESEIKQGGWGAT